jgi:hypothetical protein
MPPLAKSPPLCDLAGLANLRLACSAHLVVGPQSSWLSPIQHCVALCSLRRHACLPVVLLCLSSQGAVCAGLCQVAGTGMLAQLSSPPHVRTLISGRACCSSHPTAQAELLYVHCTALHASCSPLRGHIPSVVCHLLRGIAWQVLGRAGVCGGTGRHLCVLLINML